MNCIKCSKPGKIKTDNKIFCNRCFCEVIEKRVRKEIRLNELISKNDTISVYDEGTEKSAVLIYLLKKIINDPTIKLSIKKTRNIKGNDKFARSDVLDDEAGLYLKSMFENKKQKDKLYQRKIIKPLIVITRKEALNFAKIKKLDFKESKPVDEDIQEMIDRIEDRYPGTKFGILKTIRKTL